jgi:hypothetical protein
MKTVLTGIACAVLALTIGLPSRGGEPTPIEPNAPHRFRCRFAPAGGWNPHGGGLFHWWNPHCFPRPCGPDDYQCKPLPSIRCSPLPADCVPQVPVQATH